MTATPSAPSERTRIRRSAHNAADDTATLHAIIDAAYICHVAFHDGTSTHCIQTACWREADHLVIHGSNGSRLIKLLAQGTQACVTITHLDGLVMARAAFNQSMNYRSAITYGQFERVDGEAARRASMDAFMHKIAPGRLADVRPGNDQEFAATTVMRIGLAEAACKLRAGGPKDDAEDMDIPAWTGVLPVVQQRGEPAYVMAWRG